jgi:2-polyprenyl-6-methoxyphenol hydroxylase-like FAD-dependent oxidoreductase
MRVVVVGAGVAGLGTALALGRAGHEVTVLERDATPMPADPDEAFAWHRPGAPQVRHSHALLARLRNLLRDELPDVLADLLDVGATEIRFLDMLPETILDRSPRPGDDDAVALACRRTTFEWVLRRSALAAPHVRLLDGVAVDGLRVDDGGRSTVTGVHLHDADPIDADLVVVANGRRSPLPDWLATAGIALPEHEEDTGIVYSSRFYRLLDDVGPPMQEGPIAGDLGYCKFAVFDGDNRTFSITLACAADDEELRKRFADPDGFTAAARSLTHTAPWVADGVAEPITGVNLMARLINRRRQFLDADGRPLVRGLVAVGDAHTCTNPLYGRGCSLAMVQAFLLRDALATHPDDPTAQAVAYEEACDREVLPWYRAAVSQDRFNRQVVRRGGPEVVDAWPPTGEPEPGDPARSPAVMGLTGDQVRELLRDGLVPALQVDADVFRAFIRGFNLLEPPDVLLRDPVVIARVLETYQDRANRPPADPIGPTREQMLGI